MITNIVNEGSAIPCPTTYNFNDVKIIRFSRQKKRGRKFATPGSIIYYDVEYETFKLIVIL